MKSILKSFLNHQNQFKLNKIDSIFVDCLWQPGISLHCQTMSWFSTLQREDSILRFIRKFFYCFSIIWILSNRTLDLVYSQWHLLSNLIKQNCTKGFKARRDSRDIAFTLNFIKFKFRIIQIQYFDSNLLSFFMDGIMK